MPTTTKHSIMAIWTYYSATVAVALLTVAGAQRIEPINDTQTDRAAFEITNTGQNGLADQTFALTALTFSARGDEFSTGRLSYVNTSSASNFSNGDLAYISCDGSDYSDGTAPFDFVTQIIDDRNASAVILFSREVNGCVIRDSGRLEMQLIYSMTDPANSRRLLENLATMESRPNLQYFVTVRRSQNGTPGGQPQTVLGGTPSTAVAMIILYSITGVITALFLIIIMTGAIRAHRHPERYGPRDVQGRPRQSRARGIARAMLDTLPIVKFGENEPPKATDVELGTRSGSAAEGDRRASRDVPVGAATTTEMTTAGVRKSVEDTNGIAPAESRGAEQSSATNESGLECSICAEEFERGQDVRVLPCDHKFHAGCVDQWLLNVSGTCPLCRVDLRPTPSNTNENENGDGLAPPLDGQTSAMDRDARRRSALLFLRNPGRPTTQEERIQALRTLRNQDPITGITIEDSSVPTSRRRRLTLRLQETFNVRTRRHAAPGETETPAVPQQDTQTPSAVRQSTVAEEPRVEAVTAPDATNASANPTTQADASTAAPRTS